MDQVELIARVNKGRAAAGFTGVEPWLVECAGFMRHADLKDEVRYAIDVLDPHGSDDRAEEMTNDRYVKLDESFEGCGGLTGWLEPLTRALVQRELDRLERELFEEEWAETKLRLGREPTLDELPNTVDQRRHDALRLMAQRSAAYSGRVGPACCVNLHMGWATWFAELARLEGRTDVAFPEDALCELDDGTVIPASLAVNAALAGWVRRCVFGPDSEILDYGRANRLFTATQRQAIIAKTPRRRCPHCDTPATRCDMDHLTEYEDGGPTNVSNGGPACRPYNRWKHRDKRRRRNDERQRPPPDDPSP